MKEVFDPMTQALINAYSFDLLVAMILGQLFGMRWCSGLFVALGAWAGTVLFFTVLRFYLV